MNLLTPVRWFGDLQVGCDSPARLLVPRAVLAEITSDTGSSCKVPWILGIGMQDLPLVFWLVSRPSPFHPSYESVKERCLSLASNRVLIFTWRLQVRMETLVKCFGDLDVGRVR
uniref:Uncharacterized protein n=1 Tax=Steinernema glaseri TaxID=37863 RepID=A0A1I7Y5C1_9BILA